MQQKGLNSVYGIARKEVEKPWFLPALLGSEPSAASGGYSEVSAWPRSKFQAPAVRQRRNFWAPQQDTFSAAGKSVPCPEARNTPNGKSFVYRAGGVKPRPYTPVYYTPAKNNPTALRRGTRRALMRLTSPYGQTELCPDLPAPSVHKGQADTSAGAAG